MPKWISQKKKPHCLKLKIEHMGFVCVYIYIYILIFFIKNGLSKINKWLATKKT